MVFVSVNRLTCIFLLFQVISYKVKLLQITGSRVINGVVTQCVGETCDDACFLLWCHLFVFKSIHSYVFCIMFESFYLFKVFCSSGQFFFFF